MRKSILISATALLFSLSASLLSAAAMGVTMKDGSVLKVEADNKVHMLDKEGNDKIVTDGDHQVIVNGVDKTMTVKNGQPWVDGKIWDDKQP